MSTFHIFSRFVAGALATAALVACAVDTDSPDDLTEEAALARTASSAQMNDVSVLYPMARSRAEMAGYVSASDNGRGGALLPGRLYTTATGDLMTRPTGPLPPGADAGLVYDELKVVAFRVDPCFANLGPIAQASSCQNQLRLIFQSLRIGGTGATKAAAIDGAVHGFYSLTRDELVSFVKGVIALRQGQTGPKDFGPLAVHPLLASQGLLGAEARGLRDLVLKHAGTSNLIRFTKFSPGNLATRWDFSGFDVAHGKTTPMTIPTLPKGTTGVSFFGGFGIDLAGGFLPETSAADDMQLLGDFAKAKAASPAERQAAFDAALKIENPTKHSPNTIDCASCHVAGVARVVTGEKLGLSPKGNPNAFAADPKFVSAANMKQTTPIGAGGTIERNFHIFSYRDSEPMIAMRVINESASVVTALNGTILR